MGNKVFREVEFPHNIKEIHAYLPDIGDIVEFDPCFQCTEISAVRKAGPSGKAVIIKIKYGAYVEEDKPNCDIDDDDYDCIVYGRVITETSITPYCEHSDKPLIIHEGLETILRYRTFFKSVGTDAEGWIIKNKTPF